MKALWTVPVLVLGASIACAQTSAPDKAPSKQSSIMPSARHVSGDPSPGLATSTHDVQWGPAPDVLPSGAEVAVLQGNPFAPTGNYTLRLKMPNGYTVGPHCHPHDEIVTVIQGNLIFGMGDHINRAETTTLHNGGLVNAAQGVHHYVIAQGETIVQVDGLAPFQISYLKDGPCPWAPQP
ncbi:MAG TPA: cupin domain-containing protein [Gemmatimonadaceae bacterium]|nr:cupin domain-containing protein [Gemmatimonadaceae bacterium]